MYQVPLQAQFRKLKNFSWSEHKAKIKYFAVPVEQKWKVDLVKEILELRWNNDENDVMIDDLKDVEEMLENCCVL